MSPRGGAVFRSSSRADNWRGEFVEGAVFHPASGPAIWTTRRRTPEKRPAFSALRRTEIAGPGRRWKTAPQRTRPPIVGAARERKRRRRGDISRFPMRPKPSSTAGPAAKPPMNHRAGWRSLSRRRAAMRDATRNAARSPARLAPCSAAVLIYRLDPDLVYATSAFLPAGWADASLHALRGRRRPDALYVEPGVSTASSTSDTGTPVTISAPQASSEQCRQRRRSTPGSTPSAGTHDRHWP